MLALACFILGLVATGCGDDSSDVPESHAGARLASASLKEGATPAPYALRGRIVADSGFRPTTDGFTFSNYKLQPPHQNLTAAEMVNLFGRQVCVNPSGPCKLIGPASQRVNQWNTWSTRVTASAWRS